MTFNAPFIALTLAILLYASVALGPRTPRVRVDMYQARGKHPCRRQRQCEICSFQRGHISP